MVDLDTDGFGEMQTVDLPFSFRFYGKLYNMISVSSNGFIVPGQENMQNWMNWPLPGPFLPSPLIAPFWDDLLTTDEGNVFYYVDEESGFVIIQWSRMINRFSENEETFQAILYDSNVYDTNLGDSVILYNYHTINNDDQGNYESYNIDHGEFATVGISNSDGLIGIEYTYSNQYPFSAKELENNMTLTISGPSQPIFNPFIIINELEIIETSGNMNNIIDAGEEFEISAVITNLGISEAENVVCELSCDDQFISISQNFSTFDNINYDQTTSSHIPFQISISSDCPNGYRASLSFEFSGDNFEKTEEYEITINAKEMSIVSFSIDEPQDGFIGAAETGTMTVILKKESYLTIDNLEISLSIDDENISITPYPVILTNIEDEFVEAQFEISTTNSTPVGINIPFIITYNYDSIIQTYSNNIMFGNPLIIFEDNFDTDPIYVNWTHQNVSLGEDNYAGGDGYEAVLSDENGDFCYLLSDSFTIMDARKLIIKFKGINFDGSLTYGIVGFGGDTSSVLFSSSDIMQNPQDFIVDFTFQEPYSGPFQIYFYIYSSSEYESSQIFAIDDVEILTISGESNVVSGDFSFDENPGEFSEIILDINGLSVPIDENGHYSVILPNGDYTVAANLEGYYMESVDFEVYGDDVNLDFELEYLEKPINLTYELEENSVYLNWEYEGELNRKLNKNRQPEIDHFTIYMVIDGFGTYTIVNEDLDYSRNLYIDGNYLFYVTADYDETESFMSNTVSFDFEVDNQNDIEIPKVFALNQNYPNPFNPSTSIGFDLPKDRFISINIYNLKGQFVRQLGSNQFSAGHHSVSWDGKNNDDNPVGSGVYFYEIVVDGISKDIKKCIMMK
ncbi:MAG: FlgD immunoglobulin-like domain containing protein [Candidatus Cloacimonadota bacterium]|nr:FlgD immunoglobulin-like domain containing protein [Candidatus Cloacimonadota bacterium]